MKSFHPYAELFPLIEGPGFDELVDDIKKHGLRERIWLYDGQILDGRNRYRACQKAGVVPEYREYTGGDALAFVVSLNIARRHLTANQRAFLGARIATLQLGANQHTARAAPSQKDVAQQLGVSPDSIQRARKVIEQGSKALQDAAEDGEVSLKKAASVVTLPKPKQLSAATAKKVLVLNLSDPDVADEHWIPDEDEESKLELAEKEYHASIDKVMAADDKLAAANDELKRQAAEIAALRISRDGFMNGKAAVTKMLKAEQRKTERLERQLATAQNNIEALRERTAIMAEAS